MVSLGKRPANSVQLVCVENSVASQISSITREYSFGEVFGVEAGWVSEGLSP